MEREHQSITLKEIDLEKYIEKSNDINILVKASYYKETRRGKYNFVLLI